MSENKITTYLLYAVGEIVLVVVGILIAVTIDGANQERLDNAQQIQHYKGIVTDLRKDSVHFALLNKNFREDLEAYYAIYEEVKQTSGKDNTYAYERMLYNRSFAPVTQKNHQTKIDKITDTKTRELLNEYFQRQEYAQQATEEFNLIIVEQSRPHFFSNNILNFDAVFHADTYGFLPDGPLLHPDRIKKHIKDEKTIQILAMLRISAGHRLSELNRLREKNSQLIEYLAELATSP